MEIDKTLVLPATPTRAWALLLDPEAMAQCVPGMQSVQVVSPDEYTAEMVTKVSFITARMKLRVRVVERDEPRYLKAEGTGEDSGIASSMKQTTEMHLEALPDGQTQLRMKVKVDVVGRLATFGLSALKTKADRLWDEFGPKLIAQLQGEGGAPATSPISATPTLPTVPAGVEALAPAIPAASAGPATPAGATPSPRSPQPQVVLTTAVAAPPALPGDPWWRRLFGLRRADVIVVDWQRPDGSRLTVQWPAHQAQVCLAWLQQIAK